MGKLAMCVVLLVIVCSSLWPPSANAEGGIVVYFDPAGTQRSMNSPGVGEISTLFIYGEGFEADFISGVQYAIDYSPSLTFLADIGLPSVSIGTSASGISIGFGLHPRAGSKFLIHIALVEWNDDCSSLNTDLITTSHPLFPESTPMATRYPDQGAFAAEASRSQLCQLVEIDIEPLVCPNVFAVTDWSASSGEGRPRKGAWLAVAILGSETVDIASIDPASIRLEGVPTIAAPTRTGSDVGLSDDVNQCLCVGSVAPAGVSAMEDDDRIALLSEDLHVDGREDLVFFFDRYEVTRAIPAGQVKEGSDITLMLTGAYSDGMPFSSTGCIRIVSPLGVRGGGEGSNAVATLGPPIPNPFNPVTRIEYSITAMEFVTLAVYDVAGRLVEQLVDEARSPGTYVVEWDASSLPSGVYFYRMRAGGETIVRRATLLK